MKKYLGGIVVAILVLGLTGCASVKYTMDQTFGNHREFDSFRAGKACAAKCSKSCATPKDDILLAKVDNWIKKHLW